jgi:hypothetical protein
MATHSAGDVYSPVRIELRRACAHIQVGEKYAQHGDAVGGLDVASRFFIPYLSSVEAYV